MGVQKARWGKKGAHVRAGDNIFFHGKGKENYHLGTGFLYVTEQCQQLRE